MKSLMETVVIMRAISFYMGMPTQYCRFKHSLVIIESGCAADV